MPYLFLTLIQQFWIGSILKLDFLCHLSLVVQAWSLSEPSAVRRAFEGDATVRMFGIDQIHISEHECMLLLK
jgi:hypothetical protein